MFESLQSITNTETPMRRHVLCLLSTLFSLALSNTASAQYIVGTRDAKALRADSVFQSFDRTDSPGCALGVYQDGVLTYARGYGMASLENSVPISPRTVLDIGSMSKQFTAMSMLILMKEGKLSLDDPIRKIFPEMPPYADRITWRRALSQTSGLRDLWTLWGQTGRTFAGDTIDALNIIVHSAETNYEPGERYLYTNTGWILAAQAVYRLTGKTLGQFAEERIFQPLGMQDTRYLVSRSAVIPNLAESYSVTANRFRVARNNYDGAIVGAGGVHTTIEDFGRWLNNYDAGIVGGSDILAIMTTATTLNDGSPARSQPGLAYAVGLTVGTVRGLRVVSHGGSWGGFRAHFMRFPDQKFAVATLCNHAASGPDTLARKVAAIYIGDKMKADTVVAWTDSLARQPRVTLPAAALSAFTGAWRNVARGEVRRMRLKGDTLIADGSTPIPYIPLGNGRFRIENTSEIRFEGDGSMPSRMFTRTATDTATFIRADTVVLTDAMLAEYAGNYRSDEIDVTQTWKVEKGKLVVSAGYRPLGTLEPTYKDGFTRGGSVIDVTRDARGRITGYTIESGRVRHLRFTRMNNR